MTALAPEIGYDAAPPWPKSLRQRRTIRDLARERHIALRDELESHPRPAAMVEPGRSFASAG